MLKFSKWVYDNINKLGNCYISNRNYEYEKLLNHFKYKCGNKIKVRYVTFTALSYINNKKTCMPDGDGWIISY